MKSSGRKKTWPPLKANTTSAMAIPMASVRSTLFFSCWGASYVAEDGDSFRPPRTLSAMRSCSCFMAGRQVVKRQRLQAPNRGCGFWFVVWAERRGVSLGAIRRPRRMLRPPSLRLPVRLADAFGAVAATTNRAPSGSGERVVLMQTGVWQSRRPGAVGESCSRMLLTNEDRRIERGRTDT
jgi:hypothetical protein